MQAISEDTAMQHAISNAGAAEAGYYRQLGRAERLELAAERRAEQVSEMLDSFTAKDAQDALDASASRLDASHEQLCEALAGLLQINANDQRPAVRAVITAWRAIASQHATEVCK